MGGIVKVACGLGLVQNQRHQKWQQPCSVLVSYSPYNGRTPAFLQLSPLPVDDGKQINPQQNIFSALQRKAHYAYVGKSRIQCKGPVFRVLVRNSLHPACSSAQAVLSHVFFIYAVTAKKTKTNEVDLFSPD